MKNKLGLILASTILMAFGFLAGATFVNWAKVSNSFFSFSLTDVLGLIITVSIGMLAANWIARYVNYDVKRRELFIRALEKLENKLTTIYISFNDYSKDANQRKAKKILRDFSEATKQVSLIKQIQSETSFSNDVETLKLENLVLIYKNNITDSPFGDPDPAFGDDRLSAASSSHSAAIQQVTHIMLGLYS